MPISHLLGLASPRGTFTRAGCLAVTNKEDASLVSLCARSAHVETT